ncbi:MAG: arsenite methyltransferase [Bacteroidales bacterium]|nr:arsenite methyltransferase [Bacteroidales bacterium]
MKPEELKKVVREKYGEIASGKEAEAGSCCCGTSGCCSGSDYTVFSEDYNLKEGYNPEADLHLGCGIPTDFADIAEGDHVLDLGSGAGNDCFVARAIVGETGKVTGLDMTEQMILKAKENCAKLNFKNVEFVSGDIEEMPFGENTFDVVISNCVLNLVPDKRKAFSEINRVLKPGGHFCVSDVVIKGDLPENLRQDAEMYAGCVSGAIDIKIYLEIINDAGFEGVKIHKQKRISLPVALLSGYLSGDEIKELNEGENGIFSITVSADK